MRKIRENYDPPCVVFLSIKAPLGLLETLSIQGNVSDFVDDGGIDMEDYYPTIQ